MIKILLAPMDGISDYFVRQILTAIGGYDLCMTEFLRVTNSVFPKRVFYQNCPELLPRSGQKSHTRAGTPVSIQLLGNHPGFLAQNARKAALLGAYGIDLNFGCPSAGVNRRGAGAILLRDPKKIHQIVSFVANALPQGTQLSVKMRMGYQDAGLLSENLDAIALAGAHFVTIHARTQKDAYRPPARWQELGDIITHSPLPVVMNGEIWSVADYYQCYEQSHCGDIMLARGAFAQPDLALQIRQSLLSGKSAIKPMDWQQVVRLLLDYYQALIQNNKSDRYISGRLKLWLKWLMASFEEAVSVFMQIKREHDHRHIYRVIYLSAKQ